MAGKRLKVRKIREILRYHFDFKLSNEQVAGSLKVSKGSIANVLKRFKESGLLWPLEKELSNSELENTLYPPRIKEVTTDTPDLPYLQKELLKPHMTLQRLWYEYQKDHPNGLSRATFYRYFNEHSQTPVVTMKQFHKGGDKLFVDYSGDSISYYDKESQKVISTELFVCSWGASSFTYVEVTRSQNQEDFVKSHVRALEYFGCVPHAFVPDNLKSAVIKPSIYEPTINQLYQACSEYYDTVVLPPRVRKPQDKGVVESNVLHVQQFILASLRNRTFYSLREINDALHELLIEYNNLPMKEYDNKTRKERFLLYDKPLGKLLPQSSFTISDIVYDIKVPSHYHIRYKKCFYSVPYEYVGKRVDLHCIGNLIEIYSDGEHLCRHQILETKGEYRTTESHMPAAHKFVKNWSASSFIFKAGKIGSQTASVVKNILDAAPHPEQGYKKVMGVLQLAKAYSNEQLEKASARALHYNSISYGALKSILENGLEDKAFDNEKSKAPLVYHENLRYDYSQGEENA